jgi:hypothetical protein
MKKRIRIATTIVPSGPGVRSGRGYSRPIALLIPRVFHQIWLGPKPLPEDSRRYQRTWLERHRGWELRLWTEENLPAELRRPEVRDRLRAAAERTDILRLELLWRHGGVYVDTACECLRSIEPLLDGVSLFAAEAEPGRVDDAVVGSVPAHPLLDQALDELRPREFHGYDSDATGDGLLNRILQGEPDATLITPGLFYSGEGGATGGGYAIRHGERSRDDEDGLRARLARVEGQAERAEQERKRAEAELRAALEEASPLRRVMHLLAPDRSPH